MRSLRRLFWRNWPNSHGRSLTRHENQQNHHRGFVIQTYDTDLMKWTGQEYVAALPD